MREPDNGLVLGIMTDEDAMFELLGKFLGKEGYETRRVSLEASETEDLALVILAATRDPGRSRSWFENLKKTRSAVLIVRCCDEDYSDADGSAVILKERPLNLKQLSETIRLTLEKRGSLASSIR